MAARLAASRRTKSRVSRANCARSPDTRLRATRCDISADALAAMSARAIEICAMGVASVRVCASVRPHARACLTHLAGLPAPVLPVLLCDGGIDPQLVEHAMNLGFAGLVFDTAVKDGRTLFDCVDEATLAACIDTIRAKGVMVGIAGSLG